LHEVYWIKFKPDTKYYEIGHRSSHLGVSKVHQRMDDIVIECSRLKYASYCRWKVT